MLFDDESPPSAPSETKTLGEDDFVMGDDSHELGLPKWTGARTPAARPSTPKAPPPASPEPAPEPDLTFEDDDDETIAPQLVVESEAEDEELESASEPDEAEDEGIDAAADDETDEETDDEDESFDASDEEEAADVSTAAEFEEPAEAVEEPEEREDLEHVFEPPVPPPPTPRAKAPRRSRKSEPPSAPNPSLSPWIAFAAILVLAYAGVTWSLLAQPARADRWIGRLPGFGRFEPSTLLARSVVVAELEGRYERLGDREPAFVARGQVVSNASVSLNDVQVRGQLLATDGRVLAEKSVFCGATASSAVLSDLDSREVSILQRIQPPPRFALPPGQSAPFVLVFPDPPAEAAEVVASIQSASEIDR